MPDYYVGIEGISMRYSVGVLSDASGRVLAGCRLPKPLSLHTTNREELVEGLIQLLLELARCAGCRYPDLRRNCVICVGLTGVTFPFDASVQLPSVFEETDLCPVELICTGDAEIVFASHCAADRGVVLICHMGSAVNIVTSGVHRRYGGWGPLIGDEGSGYWIGRRCLGEIAREHDAREPLSPLWHKVKAWLDGSHDDIPPLGTAAHQWAEICGKLTGKDDPRQAIFALIYNLSRFSLWDSRCTVSSLTHPVCDAAERGYERAQRVLDEAAAALARQFISAVSLADFDPSTSPVVLYGGVLKHAGAFRDMLLKHLQAVHRPGGLILPGDKKAMRPVFGALLYALAKSQTGALRLPQRGVRETLLNQSFLHSAGALAND